ncbi:Meiotic recombination protein DMC1-like protein, partial [Drosera capensis]
MVLDGMRVVGDLKSCCVRLLGNSGKNRSDTRQGYILYRTGELNPNLFSFSVSCSCSNDQRLLDSLAVAALLRLREVEHNQMKFDESDQIKDEMDLFLEILILSSPGIDAGEVNKQQDARICASDGRMMHNKKSVTRIKEFSEASFFKMFEAAEKLMNFCSITDSDAEFKRQAVIIPIVTTGSQALDELLSGEDGIKSLAITEMADSTTRLLEVNMSGREELKECQQQLAAKLSRLIKTAREFKLAIYMASQVIADLGGGVLESGPKLAGGHMLAPRATITLAFREGKSEQPICRDADASNLTELLMASSAEATSEATWIRLVIGRTALLKLASVAQNESVSRSSLSSEEREAFALINARSEETCVGSVDAVELLKAELLDGLVRATREPTETSSNWIVDAAHLLKLFPLLTRTRAGSSHDPPSNSSKLSLHMLHVISHASTSDSSPVASTSSSNPGKTSRRSSLREPPIARLERVAETKPEAGLTKSIRRWKPNMSKANGRLSCVLLGKSEIAKAFSVLDPVTKQLWLNQNHHTRQTKFDQLDYSTDGWLLMRKSR